MKESSMKVRLIIPMLVSFNFLFSMDLQLPPIQAPLFGNNIDLENQENLKRGLANAKQFEFYDGLSWEAKEVCDGCAQKACQAYNLRIPRSTSFLSFRETRCAYAQAYISGEPRALALFKWMDDKVAVEQGVNPDLFKATKLEECCDRSAYTFCESHLDEYKDQAVSRICKESEFLPMTYAQMAGYLPTAKDKIAPLAQRMFDEIHLILRIAQPSRTPLQVADELIWIETPEKKVLGALEANELHDRNGGLDLSLELTALVLWANRESGKKVEEMSNQDLMKNFLRILIGNKEPKD